MPFSLTGTVKALPPKLGKSASQPFSDDGPTQPRSSTPRLAKTGGISGRLARSENNLTRLAGTVAARHHLCEATKSQPQLLWEKARTGEQALPALARCGGAEEAAYAIASRPELLEVEAASSFRSALQALAGFFGNLKDGLFLLGQTTAPPSVKVHARQFCREYMVGEYFLIGGAQVDDRPVWCKPASSMAHLGSRAKDVYLVYCQKGVVGSDQQHPCWTFSAKYTSAMKKQDYCDPEILGWAASKAKSPDQIREGHWHFPAENHKTQVPGLWPNDRYVDCTGGGQPLGPWLCLYSPQDLRHAFDLVRVALHVAWMPGCDSGSGPRLLGHILKQDPVFRDKSKITFLDTADFAHIRRWLFLQVPASLPDSTPVQLRAWEPIEVCMLFSAEEGGSKSHEEALVKADFRLMPEGSVAKVFPKIAGAPPLAEQVWARTYPRGLLEFPIPVGPCNLPPLIFMHSQICALVQGTRPCLRVRPLQGEDVYLPDPLAEVSDADATLLPKPKPVMYKFVSPGELGYTGYTLFQGPPCSQHCTSAETQMRIESMEQLTVALLLFPTPQCDELEEPPPERSATKRGSSKDRPPSKNAPVPPKPKPTPTEPPEPPAWLAEAWKAIPQKVATTVESPEGTLVKCIQAYTQNLEPGEVLSVPGCGPDFFAIFLYKQTSPERPDVVRPLVLREPALLAAGDRVEALLQQLSAELGDEMAREVLMTEATTQAAFQPPQKLTVKGSSRTGWPKLCQEGSHEDIARWIFEHKVDVLAGITSEPVARDILKSLGGLKAPVTVPLMQDRCAAIRELLDLKSISATLQSHPKLLTHGSETFRESFREVEEHLGTLAAREVLRAHPNLLMVDSQLLEFFSIMSDRFNDDDLRHLQQTGSGILAELLLVGSVCG
ncbi:unnamed protein product [Symbiodinium microadriaticum]|nr:unnamed protein product [Symbiodinium microadriaticum]